MSIYTLDLSEEYDQSLTEDEGLSLGAVCTNGDTLVAVSRLVNIF